MAPSWDALGVKLEPQTGATETSTDRNTEPKPKFSIKLLVIIYLW